MHILVTAPIPSHPQNHGNRARVFALCRALQKQGAIIHYVYGGLEGLSEHQELAMRRTWDHVYTLPHDPDFAPHRKPHTIRAGYRLDDWYRPAMDKIIERILGLWRIDYCLANYVWFCRWLDLVPDHIPRLIDTHDVFASRHQRLRESGISPSWFSTSAREEAKALKRASHIIAIQDSEAAHFRALASTPVTTLGHFIEPHFLPPAFMQGAGNTSPNATKRTVVGYMASDNPINQASLRELDAALSKRRHLRERFEFRLAGAICASSAAEQTHFTRVGFVESLEDFYKSCDLIINPNIGGTGLKIKSIEALTFGKALLATKDALTGIPSDHPLHSAATITALCDQLEGLDPAADIPALEEQARQVTAQYNRVQQEALQKLFPGLFDTSSTALSAGSAAPKSNGATAL